MDKFYTTIELAELLKMEQVTIRRYLTEGKIKGFKIGKEWRVSEEELKRFLDEVSN